MFVVPRPARKDENSWYCYYYLPNARKDDLWAVMVYSDRYVWKEGNQWTRAEMRINESRTEDLETAFQLAELVKDAACKLAEMNNEHNIL